MSTELSKAEEFICSKLMASEVIQSIVDDRVNAEVSLDGVYPCVVFSLMSSLDLNGSGATRIGTSALFLVRGIAQGESFSVAESIAAGIDEALQAQRLELEDGIVISCVREQPFSTVDIDSGTAFYHRGGIYRILVH